MIDPAISARKGCMGPLARLPKSLARKGFLRRLAGAASSRLRVRETGPISKVETPVPPGGRHWRGDLLMEPTKPRHPASEYLLAAAIVAAAVLLTPWLTIL